MLKNSDWMIINSIAYKIHAIEDLDQMRLEVMEQLKHLISYDSSSFYLGSSRNLNELQKPVGICYAKEDMEAYINQYKNVDYSEGLMATGKNIVYRESDIIEEAVRIQSDYYKSVYDVQGWHYSLHHNICYNEQFLGVMSFFRKKGKENFTYDDIFVLDMLKDHLALRLFQNLDKKLTAEACITQYHLSKREADVLRCLMTNKTMEEITKQLAISINTLHKHASHIYEKLEVSGRLQMYDKIENK